MQLSSFYLHTILFIRYTYKMEKESTQTSRSIAVLGILITLIAVSAVVPAKWLGGEPKKQPHKKLNYTLATSPGEVAQDLDKDGKISWNEVINDTLQPSASTSAKLSKIAVDPKSIAELNDPNNLTASFSKNLYISSAYLVKNGINDEKSKAEVLANIMQQEANKIVPTTYYYKDINIAKTESKESIRVYGNTMSLILQNIITEKIIVGDISNVTSFLQSKNPADLSSLRNNKKRLEDIIQKLLKISVPPSALTYHTLAINRIAAYKDIIDNLSVADTDPIRQTFVIEKYPDTVKLVALLFNQFSNYFDMQNIIFTSKDAGYVFITGYTISK